jgi:hypothetical protein
MPSSETDPVDAAAARMALTSACAVGSHVAVTRFVAVLTTVPAPASRTIAANGPPSVAALRTASARTPSTTGRTSASTAASGRPADPVTSPSRRPAA